MKAIFKSKKGELQFCAINYVPNIILSIKSKNQFGIDTGYVNIYFHENNRMFLDTIYCYDKFRGNGIATKIFELAEYILREYDGYLIRGDYNPSQLSTDRENKIECSEEELNKRAESFYKSNGFEIIDYNDYMEASSEYDGLTVEYDFQLGEDISKKIVVKQLRTREKYNFLDTDGIILERGIIEEKNKQTIELDEK